MNVVILDTGCANLNSVKSAIARHGYEPKVSRDPDIVLLADKLFLPGVGTAQAAMDQVRERELFDLIKACTQPVLGICLGMQLLGRRSEESNGVDLLGIIDEDVPKITAAVQKDNFYGVQFHPERSGAAGAKLLKNFLEM